jgi:hypothetical protein
LSFNSGVTDEPHIPNYHPRRRMLLVPGIIFVEKTLINQQDMFFEIMFCHIFGKNINLSS